MKTKQSLIQDYLADRIELTDLTETELDAILDELIAIAESLLDTEHHDAGIAMLAVLDRAVDLRCQDLEAGFEQAITAAEARGSTYWEFEEYLVH
jgi:hypothetical protein